MAQQGRPIPAATMAAIQRLRQHLSIRGTARAAGVARQTVRKYTGTPKK